jgi:prepilin peptidase CpaA
MALLHLDERGEKGLIPTCRKGFSKGGEMNLAGVPHSQDLQMILKILYAGALCYGFASDVRSLKIPNGVSIAVLSLFFVNFAAFAHSQDISGHLLVGGLTLALGFVIFALGFMGAGDIKLIAALMLWAGPKDAYAFLIAMTLIGGIFAALLLATRKVIGIWPSAYRYVPSRRLKNWATRGIFPYGIAICTAGLILMPSFFAQSP